jgi:HAD superfamily hydrolase (TIGR01509 family)
MKKVRGILWDNDGVLVDSESLFYEANRELFLEYGIALTEQDFFNWYLADNCGAWHLLRQQGLSPAQIAECRGRRNQRYARQLSDAQVPAVPGVETLLAELSPRLAMGIVTSATAEHFGIIHGKLGLLRHFRFVLTAEAYAHSKPAPDAYLLGLQRLALDAADCLVIEDSPRGLQAALACGLRCVIMRNRLTRHYGFAGAYRVVDDMAQLQDMLDTLT